MAGISPPLLFIMARLAKHKSGHLLFGYLWTFMFFLIFISSDVYISKLDYFCLRFIN